MPVLSVAEAITLMLAFGSFVLSLVNTFVTPCKCNSRQSKRPSLDFWLS
ncbi:putative holin-like toxin [Lacticaseibacillus paracasei]